MMTCSGISCTGIITGIPITGGTHTHTIMILGSMIPGTMILGMVDIITDAITIPRITTVTPFTFRVAGQVTIPPIAESIMVDGTGI